MGLFNRIQKADVFWRKVIVFAALAVLAVPLFILVVNNAKSKMKSASPAESLKMPDFKLELESALESLEISTSSEEATTSE